MLNLILGILWLAGAVGLFGYEFWTGELVRPIRSLNISTGWLLLALAVWNFVRFYSARAYRAEQESLRIAHEAKLRQVRYRERPREIDPTFDFTDKPEPPPGPNLTDRPPSAN